MTIGLPSTFAARVRAGRRQTLAAYERSRFAPHQLADAAMSWQYRRADARCAKNPEWAKIEARRRSESGGVILFSDEAGLGPREWARQDEIRTALAPSPRWFAVARVVRDRPVRQLHRRARRSVQLAVRGWADQDTWALDWVLCSRLAAQLDHLAGTGHGYPGDEEFPTAEVWEDALRAQAARLRRWVERDDSPVQDTYHEALMAGVEGDELDALQQAADQDREERYTAAQDALHWVADHLGHLWD